MFIYSSLSSCVALRCDRCTFKYYNLQRSYREDSATTSSTPIYHRENNALPSVRLLVGTRKKKAIKFLHVLNSLSILQQMGLRMYPSPNGDIDRDTQEEERKTRMAIHPRPFPRHAILTPNTAMCITHPSLITTAVDAYAQLLTSLAPRSLKKHTNKAQQPLTSNCLFGFHELPYEERPPYRILVASALSSAVAVSSTPRLRQPNESETNYYY